MSEAIPRTILVTGAAGFIGSALLTALGKRPVRRALRRAEEKALPGDAVVGDISPDTDWRPLLAGVDCVVHLAARTHVLDETSLNPLETYRRSNVEVTRRLAQQASAAGVRRFVFLSSIKVNGETTQGTPFSESALPAPQDAYGISKLEAENVLQIVGDQSKMEWVILRPPLVYGPGVKGNFLRLMNLIARGIPLPLASVQNQRSLIHVENLADVIIACVDTPAAAGRQWLVSDGQDISTPDLIRTLALGFNRPARLLPCPVTLLNLGAAFLGQQAAIARLTGSLAVDSSALRLALGWKPRIQLDQGLINTARWYHQTQIQRGL